MIVEQLRKIKIKSSIDNSKNKNNNNDQKKPEYEKIFKFTSNKKYEIKKYDNFEIALESSNNKKIYLIKCNTKEGKIFKDNLFCNILEKIVNEKRSKYQINGKI